MKPDDDDEWYDESWAPIVDLIEEGRGRRGFR
jgi:hypothetical protein